MIYKEVGVKKFIFTFVIMIKLAIAGWSNPVLVDTNGINIPRGGWSISVEQDGTIHFVWMDIDTGYLEYRTRMNIHFLKVMGFNQLKGTSTDSYLRDIRLWISKSKALS